MSDTKKMAAGLCLSAVLALGAIPAPAQQGQASGGASPIEVVALPGESPLVSIRLQFDAGSIHDPAGKEGLAALTALMIGEASTQNRSYKDLLEALYPMAAAIGISTEREMSMIYGTVHRDKLAEYTALIEEALLKPAFSQSDFERNKELLVAFLTNTLRSNDEQLGLELLQHEIWKGHPYGHAARGTVAGLKNVTLDDVRKFYREHYTQGGLMLGLAGGYPQDYVARLQKDLAALPAGQKSRKALPPAPKITGRNFTLVEKETGSVGIHIGFPLPVNRADPDYYPLLVANSFLGEHRTMHGRLMQQLRQERGLNYGDYSYIEFYPEPPFTTSPMPNHPRRQQYFSVWIRPVVPTDAQFALRAGLYEVQRLRDRGLTQAEFELARDFLLNYTKLWAQSQSTRLGFHMDSKFYGMPYFIDEVDARLRKMKVEDVNAAIKKYIQADNYQAVFVTDNAQALKAALEQDAASPKTYGSPPAQDVLEADKTIQAIKVQPTKVEIVPVAQVFEK